MNLVDVVQNVDANTDTSLLTREKIKSLLVKIIENVDKLKINSDVYEIYIHFQEIVDFFEEEVPDADILLNIFFDIPEIKDYIMMSNGEEQDENIKEEEEEEGHMNSQVVDKLNTLILLIGFNMMLSFTNVVIHVFYNKC